MASLNPLKALEELIVEHGSAVVQGKHLSFLKEQLTALKDQHSKLENELATANSSISSLNERIAQVLEENENLRSQLESFTHIPSLSDFSVKILESLFKRGPCGDVKRFSTGLHIQEAEVEYYFDELKRHGFVTKRGAVFAATFVPVTACLTEAGRAEVMRRRQ